MQIHPLTGGTSDGQVYPRNRGPFGVNGGFYCTRQRVKIRDVVVGGVNARATMFLRNVAGELDSPLTP